MSRSYRFLFLGAVSALCLRAHAPPTPIPTPPFHVEANHLVDAVKIPFLIRGVDVPGVGSSNAGALNPFTFRLIRQRWNMNAVRVPVSVALWKRDGAAYLEAAADVITAANSVQLLVVLAAYEDAPLPTATTVEFWRACALRFRNTSGIIFDLFNEPSARDLTGTRAQAWLAWQSAMQPLVVTIRAAGAAHIVAASSFQDSLEFQGFTPAAAIRDANVIYEVHPFYDHGVTDEERNANFGFMTGSYPVYAGAWGMPFGQNTAACRAVPNDLGKVFDILYQTLAYFDLRGISWTAADFVPGSLVQNLTDDAATHLTGAWTCDANSNPRVGIGQFILLFMTGDPNGFGSLDINIIASAAGGFVGPVAPGQIISIYGQGVGPDIPVEARLDENGRVGTTLGEIQVLFDGKPAPVLLAGAYQTNVQVPYEVEGRTTTSMQLIFRGIPSNIVEQPVVAAAPGIFTFLGTAEAAAVNQEGSVNGASNPAARGSVISLFATGAGQTRPSGVTGELAHDPLSSILLPVRVEISARPAEILYAGAAPNFAGVTQINVRLPADLPISGTERVSVALVIGGISSRQGVTFWAK